VSPPEDDDISSINMWCHKTLWKSISLQN